MYHWHCGDSLFRKYKKKSLVLSGTEMEHKWFRIASSETISIYFQKGQTTEVNTFPNPHHNSTNISVKNGENQGHKINRIKQGNLEIFTVKGIAITAEYLPSVMNTEVDRVLTQEKDFSKWNFNNKIFQKIYKIIETPNVDLIASRLTNQIPVYIAWKPDPFSSQGTDSMQQLWSQKFFYAFLPFYFITRVLHKVMFDQTENMVLLTPTWHIQA